MLTALWYGMGTAVPLLLGAAIGLRYDLPRPVLAGLMAFGAGAMVAAVSTELFAPAFADRGLWAAGGALMLGTVVYVVADRAIESKLGPAALGWALMLGALLDGIPENAALGTTLAGGAGGVVLLVAVAVGNIPESVAGAASMRSALSHRAALLIWGMTSVLLVAVVVIATAFADSLPSAGISLIQAFAGGATIAVIADSLMPEAYREGGWWVAICTSLGFLVAFALGA
ncbi:MULTISPECIES: ZIP family metal transporter [Rhodococcus]|uniref:ZIP family metal transporter n=1 Tax=Rhodococcus TaxID=1827 RepID=UPI000B5A2A68|nr:ZIP family metal transporter [Rhodococcus sp. BUPNP1]MXQ76522.1 ZIP family metal transporter [Rhodococcus rhodochrous]OWY80154.1 ZIP family metal transporter [Rhodococcus sp. BUPNP1]